MSMTKRPGCSASPGIGDSVRCAPAPAVVACTSSVASRSAAPTARPSSGTASTAHRNTLRIASASAAARSQFRFMIVTPAAPASARANAAALAAPPAPAIAARCPRTITPPSYRRASSSPPVSVL